MSEGSESRQRLCTNCGAEVGPGDQFCRSCGRPYDSGTVPRPPGGQGKTVGGAGNEFNVSDPIGSFLATVRDLVVKPATFFRGMPRQGSLANPLIFALVCILVSTVLTALVGLSFSLIGGMEGVGSAFGRFLLSVIFYPLLAVAGLFIGAGIYHLLLGLVVGQQRLGFGATLRVYAYMSVALLIAWIPILGWVVAPIWSVVLAVIGIREAHYTTTGKAALVVLTPPAVVLVLLLVLFLVLLLLTMLGLGAATSF